MAVFTPLDAASLEAFLAPYERGELLHFHGVEDGIENTNYFVELSGGRFVLTLFETLTPDDVRYCLDLMAHLRRRWQHCAQPIADCNGVVLSTLAGKPAALVERLGGQSIDDPTPAECYALGAAIAHMHGAADGYPGRAAIQLTRAWREEQLAALADKLDPQERQLAADSVGAGDPDPSGRLPGGVIHGDLFRDNVLFEGSHLSGVIDFYHAHSGPFVYDLAVAVADWCFIPTLQFSVTDARGMLDGYRSVRDLGPVEQEAWVSAMRAAATRYWLSRLRDKHFPRSGPINRIKDPAPLQKLLHICREQPERIAALW